MIPGNANTPLNVILVDDEAYGLKSLAALVTRYIPEALIRASCNTAEKGIEAIRQLNPQENNLVFLDIEMPLKSGFELLEEVKDCEFEVIFTTAFQQYAIKAFKYKAADYLLKPINPAELKAAVARITEKFRVKQQLSISRMLEKMQEEWQSENKKVALHTAEGIEYISLSQVIRCEASQSYTIFVLTGNKRIMVSKNIGEMEKSLPPSLFLRIHKSHLVNIRYIKKFIRTDGGQLLMADDALVDVSRFKKEEVLEKLRLLSL
jgi:two-component system LytT family response regulator